MAHPALYDDKKYFTGDPGKQEQMAWDRGMIRYGDQCCALGYAFGFSSFYEIRSLLGFQDTGKNPFPETTAKQQLDILYNNRRRTPLSVLDVGGGRGEIAVALASLGIKVQLVEPSAAVVGLVAETMKKFDMHETFNISIINSTLTDSFPLLNTDLDTVIFSESIEHIPKEEFDACYPPLKNIVDNNNGRIIIVNWVDFHPIPLTADGIEHCRVIDDQVYDILTDGNKTIYRQGSHLIYRRKDISIKDFSPPSFDINERRAVYDYMEKGGWLTEFEKTRELAKKIASFTGSLFCAMAPSCTTSLAIALWAIGVSHGDEVIIPDYTMAATGFAVQMTGAKPILVDIEKDTLCMDYQSMIDAVTLKTKAVVLVSINGRYPSNIESIVHYCAEHGIMLVEDAAQSLGSVYKGHHVGTYGDIGCFSFSPFKTLSMGQGGAIVTDNEQLFEKIKAVKDFGRCGRGSDVHASIGFNFHYTDLQAVIGLEQMKKLGYRLARKKAIYRLYNELLNGEVEFIKTTDDQRLWLNDIIIPDPKELSVYLRLNKISIRDAYPGLHTQKPFTMTTPCPNSEHIASHLLYLPSSPSLTDDEVEHVCEKIKIFNRYWDL